MKRRELVRAGVALAGSVAIAGCSGDSGSLGESGDDGASTEDPPEQDRPSGTRWYDSETEIGVMNGVEGEADSIGNLYIRGTAENFSDDDYDYVQLSFEVYDETDAKIADGLANTSGLAAGQRWRFEALAPGAEDASSYALTDITAY